jgi:ferredoxin
VFRDLLGWAFRQADVTPSYTAPHCLSVRGTGCHVCADVCPHEAITIQRTVKIDPIDCTGCGLCVAACPSHALVPRDRAPTERALRCSQVPGEGTSVVCLARLEATDLVRMAASGARVTLARSDCSACDVGGPAVPAAVDRNAAEAARLLALHGRELELDVVEVDRFEIPVDRRELSRRELLRGGWREVRRTSGTLLAPLERFADPDEAPEQGQPLPAEHRRRLRAIELAAPAPATLVPLRLPEVLDGCILCPACTRACPTNALRRVFDGDAAGGARLELEADRCVDCDACVVACPVDVVRMRDDVTWAEVVGPTRVVYRAERPSGPLGAVARAAPADAGPTATGSSDAAHTPEVATPEAAPGEAAARDGAAGDPCEETDAS